MCCRATASPLYHPCATPRREQLATRHLWMFLSDADRNYVAMTCTDNADFTALLMAACMDVSSASPPLAARRLHAHTDFFCMSLSACTTCALRKQFLHNIHFLLSATDEYTGAMVKSHMVGVSAAKNSPEWHQDTAAPHLLLHPHAAPLGITLRWTQPR